MSTRITCKSCDFCDLDPYQNIKAYCRKEAPKVAIIEYGYTVTIWPKVDPEKDWCGNRKPTFT